MAIEDGFIFGYMTYMIFSLSFVKCEMYDYMVLAEDLCQSGFLVKGVSVFFRQIQML